MNQRTGSYFRNSAIALAACLLAASAAHALSPPPPLPVDELIEFYHAMDGDNWHRNDGWLDTEIDVCDWYGITCVTEAPQFGGFRWVGHLRLTDNNLSGELTAELVEVLMSSAGTPVPSRQLDLSGNQITGQLSALPTTTPLVRLADNHLSGPLPEIHSDNADLPIEYLDLSGNLLTGPIPASWAALELAHLNLSSNLLEGSIQPALAALNHEHELWTLVHEHGELWLADNDFDGVLDPAWFDDWQIGSINLCWTDVVIDDPELDDWIAEHHLGGPHHACLDRERQPLDVSLSGSWYDPERDGEGFTMMLLDTGAPLIYWFTHISAGRQMWQFSVGATDEATLRFRRMNRTRGSFEAGFGGLDLPIIRGGRWRLDRVDNEILHGEHLIAYTIPDGVQPGQVTVGTPYPIPDTAVRRDYQRLTRLAGTTCDNQQPHQWISGAWYDPQQNGQGFVVEVLENGRGVVYWFSYTPESTQDASAATSIDWQAWMMGDGDFDGNTLVIDNLLQPRDTGYAMPGNADGIELEHFGTLVMEFHDDEDGHIWFDSIDEDFGTADYPIERLARPMTAECQDTSTPLAIDAAEDDSTFPKTYKGLPLALTNNGSPEVTVSDGLVGMVCIGMSNAHQECRRLIRGMEEVWSDQIDPRVRLVNCALGGHAIERWNDPDFDDVLWDDCADKVAAAGLSPEQVRVVLHKAANQFTTWPDGSPLPFYPDPASDFYNFYENLDIFAGRVTEFFPGLQAVFNTSRSYGGFAERRARGEPLSYEQGHGLNQWLHDNPSVGGIWFGWGPYIWAPDCTTGATNGAGICYERLDFQADGIHPTPAGEIKVATLWHQKLRSQSWYAR